MAALDIPSDGSDGALTITSDTVIDLSQAVTGSWDANNSANAGKGIYDASKWAVVFKYSSVTVQAGATVTFKNHASRAPVVWLVQGDVTINGTVSLDGQEGLPAPWLAEPGPGGFRGGAGYYATGAEDGSGFGPGGGRIRAREWIGGIYGEGGSYAFPAYSGAPAYPGSQVYGNPSLIPLIGGSGGAGARDSNRFGGGAGAGAILIAASQNLSISGSIHANGGANNGGGGYYQNAGGAGSGGGIRLVADTLVGNGVVESLAGAGASPGSLGRIRVERAANTSSLQLTPDPSVVTLPPGATPLIWVPVDGPTVRVVSVGGNTASADPRAGFGAIGADVVLPRVSSTTVVVETTNVEQASVVTVRATPRSNGNFTQADASVTTVVSEDPLVLRWTANVPVQDGYSAIQVKVVRP